MTNDMDPPPEDHFDNPERIDRQLPVFVPGATAMGVGLLVLSLSILFASSLLAYLIIRWRVDLSFHLQLPQTLWLSTLVLLASSFTMHAGLRAIREDRERLLAKYMMLTFLLGLVFLILQVINGLEIFRVLQQSDTAMAHAGIGTAGAVPPHLSGIVQRHVLIVAFYMFTGLHALHVIGGLIPLGLVTHRAFKGRYSRNYYPGVRYCSVYWHFLDIVWIAIFITLLATF